MERLRVFYFIMDRITRIKKVSRGKGVGIRLYIYVTVTVSLRSIVATCKLVRVVAFGTGEGCQVQSGAGVSTNNWSHLL